VNQDHHPNSWSALRRHDFIETTEGLIFAIVASGLEQQRALCFLRYARNEQGLAKLNTEAANTLLATRFPQYLFHSATRDASLHGVPVDRIEKHFQPPERAAQLAVGGGSSVIAHRGGRLIGNLSQYEVPIEHIGVTGSLLIGAESDHSDIDLVIYGADNFERARAAIASGFADGTLTPLNDDEWREAYRRRGCDLTFEEYVWHEQRKNNKAVFEGTKFDIAWGDQSARQGSVTENAKKLRSATIRGAVVDDSATFRFPARWQIEHPEITELFAFTPTYVGQAFVGEMIEACGIVERTADHHRLVVGASREAAGQWIKVIR
jgi:hypothetical protein